MPKPLEKIAVLLVIFGPGILGTVMWWFTNNPSWLIAWAWTLIVLFAG